MMNDNQKKILIILLYIFLIFFIVFTATSYKAKIPERTIVNPSLKPTISPNNRKACIQVITAAKDPRTGKCQQFPTPCDVPNGWQKVSSCGN